MAHVAHAKAYIAQIRARDAVAMAMVRMTARAVLMRLLRR